MNKIKHIVHCRVGLKEYNKEKILEREQDAKRDILSRFDGYENVLYIISYAIYGLKLPFKELEIEVFDLS